MRIKIALASLIASAICGTAAQAATTIAFTPGAASPGPGQTVVYDFDTTRPASLVTGPLVQIKSPPADANGAPPANSIPNGTNYLSVLANGFASILFSAPVTAFSFDWGSIDGYNLLTILPLNENSIVVPGTSFTNTPANGNQVSPGTNGRFSVTGTAGTQYLGFNLTSSGNSFEIDNVAVASATTSAVPELSTWIMMLLGLGVIGFSIRKAKRSENAGLGERALRYYPS